MPRRGRGRLAYRTRRGNNAPNPISPVPTEYIIGGLDIVCPYCSALHFPGETVGSSCCHKGKVILPTLSSFPYEMMELMTSNSVEAKYFQTNIRSYNSSLAFASMGAQVDVFSGQGPFCYRIHGQIYHLTGPLHPHGNRAPSYAQLYILDSEAANNTRIAASRPLECHPGILTLLDSVLRRVNPYTSAYRQMHQVELAEEHRARIENRQMCQVQMLIRQNHCRDLRRYNAPSVSEVAAIFVDQDGHVPSNRDIAVFPHDCGLVRISPLNPNCDPMIYPLLFPAGDPGWAIGILHEENMRTSTRNHVTMLQFYSYRLAIRPGFSPIHYGRRLFQQYVVDAYVKTEGNRLNYIRQNQSLLRVELYQGLMDYIHEQEHSRGVRIGRIFILPSSFPGSSRAMQQNYQDAMAIVRKFGRPDLFVTFTCNPRWTDIVENLLPNQNPSDRPDLVARVFNLKLQQLLHEIVSQHVLGVVIARVHVVEFQKRGLPHAHMLFMLREEDKPRDRDAIDRLVCAEIPSPTMQVQLYDMVRKHMIHGPCGNFNLHSPCMSDGKCTKDFPKSFLQLTEANNNGYPRYRRRDDGQTLVVGTHEVDNRWVVPYNPYLLVRFNAHINVEVCASVKSVKYLFKYVYKGHDRAEVEVSVGELDMESRAHDEIKNFLDARYVSAPEAMWRMFEYRLHAHSHTICRLAVHLPNFQSVYFVEGSEEQALENASRRRTTLTAWFQLNCVNVSARSLLYGDIPSAYVFRQNQWSARVRGGALCIGRMCSVNPKDSERYHLRLLLLHVAGAQSFEDLRTVDDIVCSTFKEAAQRRGLLADDSEWDACLAEAALFQMPCQLRQLFATILIYNNPTDPVSLWTKYKGGKAYHLRFLRVFGHGLDDDALAILASAKTRIYRYFLGVELRSVQEDLVWRRTLSRVDIEVRLASGNTGPRGPKISQTPPSPKSRQDSGRQGTSKQIDHCLYRKMEQGRKEDSKEPMKTDPDYESGESTTFPKKETTLGRTQEVPPQPRGRNAPTAGVRCPGEFSQDDISALLGDRTFARCGAIALRWFVRGAELLRQLRRPSRSGPTTILYKTEKATKPPASTPPSYQHASASFWMRNSPQIFERAINQIFQKYKLNFIAHYFDDFIIFSDTLEEHIQHVEKFLEICQQENIKLNYKKCEFLKTSIEFLGYTVKNGTYTPQTRNLDIINAIKPPFNQKTLQSFLGAVNVYNKFIPDYARLRTPLNHLLKKDTKWQWDEKCQQAFTALKESLTSKPVLHLESQEFSNKYIRMEKFIPHSITVEHYAPHERNYTISELECLAIVESIEKFRIYLSGTKFTVYSDHQALQWLKTIKNPSGRLFRWSLRLSTYDYEIQYLKGTQQHEADLLSRNPFCGFISARTIKKHQPNIIDTSVAVDVNGLHTIRRKGVNRIIIPEALQHSLMNQVHSEYNHPGISQMARLISTQYYWKGMAKSIQKFVNSCHTCQIIKRPKGKPYGTLGQIPPPQQPFDLISIDTIAGFSKYGHSKTYLHVIVDHLTRYAWAFPSKSISTLTYIQTLKKVLQQGSPKRLLSDRAPAFTSEKFRKFLLSRGIQPLLTTSNNPQANGLIERLNATITGKLRLLYLENPKTSWTKLIKQVVQIYNQSPHTVTGFPPIFLMFNSIPPELKNHYNPFPDVQKARQLASSRTQLKHERDKQRYDKGHQAPHFEIGDLVLVKKL
ncbi:hypothetical protein LAZ67_6000728 [Cordylochernes scorpioides]|uniref:RNA-directed DNA polymerase n=1 Tax=Cordylochernes scorpioides TaxID=51811 RepID=A0ABY6KLU4_9ARAC|nr:hypothetical protein LAZ67_6000728 [Cordylochernes scorpioides]